MQEENSPPSKPSRLTTVIDAHAGWFRLDLHELWQYRYLIALFIYRDFVVHYKQTILGPIWWLLQPLLMTGMFSLIFSLIAKIPTDSLPAPLFYLSGLILWNFFSLCLQHCAQLFISNADIFKKIYFPRLAAAVASIFSNLMRLVLQCLLFGFFYFLYYLYGAPIRPSFSIVLFPLLVLYVAALAFGIGLLIASLTTKYRDLVLALPFFTQLWMFASVVIFPLSQVPPSWRPWFSLNPMVPPIELFRSMCFGTGTVLPSTLMIGIVTTIVVVLFGILLFNRVSKTFTDTI